MHLDVEVLDQADEGRVGTLHHMAVVGDALQLLAGEVRFVLDEVEQH